MVDVVGWLCEGHGRDGVQMPPYHGSSFSVKVYHGSDHVVKTEDIQFPGRRKECDFGRGFYLTERRRIAEEWVRAETTPVVNEYSLKITKDQVLHLKDEDWLRVVLGCRLEMFDAQFRSPVVYGMIADDRMFDELQFFVASAIGDKRLIECLDYCKLGNQYCIREPIDGLTWERSYEIKGLQLQQVTKRHADRRREMSKGLELIRERNIPGEKFIRHYREMGAYVEHRV